MVFLSQITAVILAGGLGTRLRDTLPGVPKALADVNGQPFIRILLNRLARFGIGRVVICTGFLGHMIQECLGERAGGMQLLYSQESELLGTAGALRNARDLLPPNAPVLVMNGDSYCHADLEAFYAWFMEKKAPAAVLLARVADTRRYGSVEMDEHGKVLLFSEKQAMGGSGMMNAGAYFMTTDIIEQIPPKRPCSLEKDVFPLLVSKGGLAGYLTPGAFLDIGTKESYQRAPEFFAALEGQL